MSRAAWLDAEERRIGLGCMRLPAGTAQAEQAARATIAAAVVAGVTVFDTAHSYGPSPDSPGHNEALLAGALAECGGAGRARIVTKGGMTRAGGAWIPDGRARTIRADCEASLEALGGLGIDLYLLHAPDPRTPWETSLRALARLRDEGLVRHIGVANVNRTQLEAALQVVELDAIQVAVSLIDQRAVRGGVIEYCSARGIAVMAHSPLGGPRGAPRLMRNGALHEIAKRHDASPAQMALAWLLEASPSIVPVPGARRPEAARSAAAAANVALRAEDTLMLERSFSVRRTAERAATQRPRGADVVLVMGIPGAGKTRVAEEHAARGYLRLNRDAAGGSLRDIAAALGDALDGGARRVVLDNTYLTRASRSFVVEVAEQHGVRVRCLWLDTPLAQAQINMVERVLDRIGALPEPDDLRVLARREPGILSPTSQMRTLRELEPPSADEGFAGVQRVSFERIEAQRPVHAVFVSARVLQHDGWREVVRAQDPAARHVLFEWRPDGDARELDAAAAVLSTVVHGAVSLALCAHPGGPPRCWCRPPLPGLILAYAREHNIALSRSLLVGSGPAHRSMAAALGLRYLAL